MENLGAAQIDVFEPIGSCRRCSVDPPVSLGGVLRLASAKHQSGASNERGIDAMTAARILAIYIESKVANFLTRLPFKQYAAFRQRRRAEGNELNGGGSSDRRRERRSVVDQIGIAGGGRCRRSIRRLRRGAEGAGGGVDGDDGESADAESAKTAIDSGGRCRIRASALRSRSRDEGDLRGKRIVDGDILCHSRAVVRHLQGVSEIGALIDWIGRSVLRDGDVGLRWRRDSDRRGSGVVRAIGISGRGA